MTSYKCVLIKCCNMRNLLVLYSLKLAESILMNGKSFVAPKGKDVFRIRDSNSLSHSPCLISASLFLSELLLHSSSFLCRSSLAPQECLSLLKRIILRLHSFRSKFRFTTDTVCLKCSDLFHKMDNQDSALSYFDDRAKFTSSD